MVNKFTISAPMPLVTPKPEKLQAIARRFPVIDALSLETCIWLLRSASALAESNDAHYARHGLSRGRFYVLINLHQAEADGLTPHELAERTGVTRAATTGQIDALVEAGLVVRVQDPLDRRSYRVRLHQKGFALLEQFLPLHFGRMRLLVSGLSDEEKLLLQLLLSKVAGKLDAFTAGEPGTAQPAAGKQRKQTSVAHGESRKPAERLKRTGRPTAQRAAAKSGARTTQSIS
jgi:DNA-binding MarR family transcriptional regulator